MAILRYFGTHRKSLYKQCHLENLQENLFDKLNLEGRLFENSVSIAGNVSILMVAQNYINQLSLVD